MNLLVGSRKGLLQADFKIVAQIGAPAPPRRRLYRAEEIFEKILEKIVDGFLAKKEIVRLAGNPPPPPRREGPKRSYAARFCGSCKVW